MIKSETYYIENGMVYRRTELDSGSVSVALIGEETFYQNEGTEEEPVMIQYKYSLDTRDYVHI